MHYSVTTGESVVVSNNPYTFNGAGSQTFFVTPATSGDDDMLLAVRLDNCSSQWTLMPSSIDTLPTQICGSKGSGSANVLVACPHGYVAARVLDDRARGVMMRKLEGRMVNSSRASP